MSPGIVYPPLLKVLAARGEDSRSRESGMVRHEGEWHGEIYKVLQCCPRERFFSYKVTRMSVFMMSYPIFTKHYD